MEMKACVSLSGKLSVFYYYLFLSKSYQCFSHQQGNWIYFAKTEKELFIDDCTVSTWQVKKTGTAPNLPEDRQRYWNAYMLFYESRVEKKSAKTPRYFYFEESRNTEKRF